MTNQKEQGETPKVSNFIRNIVDADLAKGKHTRIVTRFPPEPNGYLHIGHAKSICLNFGLAADYDGTYHLRFDDTNPVAEDMEYVNSIQRDIRWLGFDWGDKLFHASDYFERMYQLAIGLIKNGRAYVCSLNEDEIRQYRGTVTQPGRPSPYRDRSVAENLDLFERMRAGEFEEGAHVLRAKIDMANPNMKMRDPLLYRIRHVHHDRTGDTWCIYPMYDYAHCLSDSVEGITHSICTLEFENNRELYDWVLDATEVPCHPQQIEFARLSLNYTVMSKRKLLQLVEEKQVNGWDDPRMPTLAGMRRRGYTPEAIRDFCERIGVAKANSTVDFAMLEYSLRDDLNKRAPRVMCVLDPIKLTITNWPADREIQLEADSFPHDVPGEGSRTIVFNGQLYIERDDFMENPPGKYYRLAPGREVRLRYAYIVTCDEVIKDDRGVVKELRCSYDPDTLGKNPSDRKVQGTIHWVPASQALNAEIRLYDRLFTHPNPDGADGDFKDYLNPDSLSVVNGLIEPSVAGDPVGSHYQFERVGYFNIDLDSSAQALVFNRTVGLRDTWAKLSDDKPKKQEPPKKKVKPAPGPVAERVFSDAEQARLDRFAGLGVSQQDAQTLATNEEAARFFEQGMTTHPNAAGLAGWISNELMRELKDRTVGDLPFGPGELAELVALIDDNTISGRVAKDVFAMMLEDGGAPSSIVEAKGLKQVTDSSALEPIVDKLLADNPDVVGRYRDGNKKLMGFFVGGVMKATGGKANPKLVNQLLARKLK